MIGRAPFHRILCEIVSEIPPWEERALCSETDPELFFPGDGQSARPAKRICVLCPVQIQCLEMAMSRDERFGVWGNMSERERRLLRLRRARAANL